MRDIHCNLMRGDGIGSQEVGCDVCRESCHIEIVIDGIKRVNYCVVEAIRDCLRNHPYSRNVSIIWTKGGINGEEEQEEGRKDADEAEEDVLVANFQ